MKRKAVYGIMLALLLTVAITLSTVVPTEAQLTGIEVINPTVGGNNFIFYTSTTKVGDRFNATIWIKDAVNLFAFQIYLTINDTLLDITRAWIPRGDIRYVFYGKPEIIPPPPTLIDNDGDGSHEAVIIGSSLLGGSGVTFTGSRLAAIVEFEIIYELTVQDPIVWDYLIINNSGTYLLDDSLTLIPALMVNGYYEYNYLLPVHDVAIIDVSQYKTVVGQGYSTFISVAVQNQGDFSENVTGHVYANSTAIATLNITLASKAATIIEFMWNTEGFAKGHYEMSAVADLVPEESDTLDNTFFDYWVFVAMPGDIAGPEGCGIPDGKCDIRDIACAAKAFGSSPIHPMWNPNADITGSVIGLPDYKVDIRDIAIIAKNFGRIDP